MTTVELHQHFDVEYDKSNVITSYPSYLAEEKDVWLNKAYSMIISQKFTGNNVRNIAFEGDIKRITDLQNLVKTTSIDTHINDSFISNAIKFDLSKIPGYLYFILANVKLDGKLVSEVSLISHANTQKFKETAINSPWIPRPVASLELNTLTLYYDKVANPDVTKSIINITYVKQPAKIDSISNATAEIEVNDNVALEIINLAVFLALENIQSQRTESKMATISIQE